MPDSSTISKNLCVLRIDGLRLGDVSEIVDVLVDVEHAYNNLYVFESLVASVTARGEVLVEEAPRVAAEPFPPSDSLPPGITNTMSWNDEEIARKLAEVRAKLDWENTTGSVRKWWEAFEDENKHRQALILRLAEELAVRNTTITEFFLAYFNSDTDNIQANLHYLDYTRLKGNERRGQSANEAGVQPAPRPSRRGSSTSKFALVPSLGVPALVLPKDKLKLHRIEFRSPGFWEFLGSLSPLEVLRKWCADSHERRKDLSYREAHEAERMRLENEKLRIEVVQGRIRLLEQAGVPQRKIRVAVTRYVVEPLGRLERHQDAGLLAGAEVVRRDEAS